MNDCVFNYMCCCKCKHGMCDKKISINSDKGRQIEKKYSEEITPIIEKAVEHIRKEIIEEYDIEGGFEFD